MMLKVMLLSALQAMAGIDKFLTPKELEIICQHYTAPKTASMDVMMYTQFLADVDVIFTKPVSFVQSHWGKVALCSNYSKTCMQHSNA